MRCPSSHTLFQLHHLAHATGGSEGSQNISTIASFSQAPPVLIRQGSFLSAVILAITTLLQCMPSRSVGLVFGSKIKINCTLLQMSCFCCLTDDALREKRLFHCSPNSCAALLWLQKTVEASCKMHNVKFRFCRQAKN